LHGLGRSMVPFIRPGDSVELVSVDSIRPGAIYLGELPDGHFVVHRLVGRKNGLAVLRGDFNSRYDPPVPEASLLGRVVRVWREGRPLNVDALLPRAYGSLQVSLSPFIDPARRATRRVRRAALQLATGPMLPVTRGLLRTSPVRQVGLDELESQLV